MQHIKFEANPPSGFEKDFVFIISQNTLDLLNFIEVNTILISVSTTVREKCIFFSFVPFKGQRDQILPLCKIDLDQPRVKRN